MPSLGVRMSDFNVLHSGYRVGIEIRRGVVRDWAMWPQQLQRAGASNRSNLFVQLAGEVHVRSAGRERTLQSGACMTEHRSRSWGFRVDRPTATLILEWAPGEMGDEIRDPFSDVKLSRTTLEACRRAAMSLTYPESTPAEVAAAIGTIFACLRAEGAPLHDVDEARLIEPVEPTVAALNHALDRSLSMADERPMLADLEERLGISERHIRRRTGDYLATYQANAAGWRELSHRWRLSTGLALMSAKGATTEGVARILGYSSPTAFCRAFAASGLPSPGAIRSLL
ncbi:MAG TPA: hypothetical protein VGD74_09265 [Vulgatibacter sp.]